MLNIPLNSSLSIPLQRQIYQSLRDSILAGRLNPGDRLPSTRAMSEALGVSRMTVTLSYEHLMSEGYLETALRSGTYVSSNLTQDLLPPETATTEDAEFRLSDYGHRLQEAAAFRPP